MRLGSVIVDGLGKNISFIRSILKMSYLTYNNKKDMDVLLKYIWY